MTSRARLLILLAVAVLFVLPAGSAAAGTDGFYDPVGDMPQFAADLGATTVSTSDEAISVESTVVPRAPAGWGGCAYSVGETCIPAEMSVTWYLDFAPGAGSAADDGADTRVVVTPERGRSLWESELWSAAGGRYVAGPRPLGSEDAVSLRWAMRLSDLGIERPAAVRIWAVSSFRSPPGLGAPLDYEDRAGPGTIRLDATVAAADGGAAPASTCKRRARASARARANASASSRPRRRLLSGMAVSPGRALGAPKRRC